MVDPEQIKRCQRRLGLTDDGIAGSATWDAIENVLKVWLPPNPKPDIPTPEPVDRVDDRSEAAIKTLHPRIQPLARSLIQLAAANSMIFKITSGTRTYAEQNALYDQGRSKPGDIVTNARGGFSSHNFGTAFDVTLFEGTKPVWESTKYKSLGDLGKTLGLSWGGDWSKPDEPHFYLKPPWASNMTEAQMMATLRHRHDANTDVFA